MYVLNYILIRVVIIKTYILKDNLKLISTTYKKGQKLSMDHVSQKDKRYKLILNDSFLNIIID